MVFTDSDVQLPATERPTDSQQDGNDLTHAERDSEPDVRTLSLCSNGSHANLLEHCSFLLRHRLVRGEQNALHRKMTPGRPKSAGFRGCSRETNDHRMWKQKNEGHLNLYFLLDPRM